MENALLMVGFPNIAGLGLRAAFLLMLLLLLAPTLAQEAEQDIVITRERPPVAEHVKLTTIATGFDRPLYVTHAGDGSGRLFLVEQRGKIWILRDGVKSAQPFLDVSHLISHIAILDDYSELGLLGLAFHPDYANNGRFFVNYTDFYEDTAIAHYQVSAANPDIADETSASLIMLIRQPHRNHNGGQLAFGPDGLLYIALGDGGQANDLLGAGQNRQILLGSILRIDVDGAEPYQIPRDNPFVDDDGGLDEIWSYGLRNPWRFSFDRATGDMYIADVGQDSREEVNFEPADSKGGVNYGWSVWEGNMQFAGGEAPNYSPPIFAYGHEHGCSVTGGYVYRGAAVPDLLGVYLFGDYCSGRVWGIWRNQGLNWQVIELMQADIAISSFGQDEAGELYMVDHAKGQLLRIDSANES